MCESSSSKHRLSFWLSFFGLGTAMVLAAIAIYYDQVTKITYGTITTSTQYCGWLKVHDSSVYISHEHTSDDDTYSNYCSSSSTFGAYKNDNCEMKTVGTVWLALVLSGFLTGALTVLGYFCKICFDCSLFSLGGTAFFTLFYIAAVVVWGIMDECDQLCSDGFQSNCKATYGLSWILCVIAAGLGLISSILYVGW